MSTPADTFYILPASLVEEVRTVLGEVRARLDARPIAPQAAPSENDLLTTAEACARLRISRPTLYRLRRQGQLTAVGATSQPRFRRADVDALIVERGTPAA